MIRVHRWLALGCITALLAAAMSGPPASAADTSLLDHTAPFSIDGQSLASGLIRFAEQSGVQVVSSGQDLTSYRTRGVRGTISIRDALKAVLEGTPLSYREVGEKTVAIITADVPKLPAKTRDPLAPLPRTSANAVAADEAALAEIVVTAQKRLENAQTLGISIAQLSAQDIHDLRLAQPIDIAGAVSGLVAVNATSDSTPIFAIRGVGLDDFNINNSSGVGIYTDEVFASSPAFLTGPTFDADRIEVLKGPQGTLYGRNTTGGAINIISRKPTHDWQGYAEGGVGRWGVVDFEGALSGPLSDTVAFRVASAATWQNRGWQSDIDTGQQLGKTRRAAVRALLEFALSERVTLLLNGHVAIDRSIPEAPQSPNVEQAATACCGTTPGVLNYFGTPIGGLLNGTGQPDQVRVGLARPFIHGDTFGSSAKLTVDFEHVALTSISAYDRSATTGLDDYCGLPVPEFWFHRDYQAQQWSQELRVASTDHGPTSWVAGVEYSSDRIHDTDSIDASFLVLADPTPGQVVIGADYTQKTESAGAYAHSETHLSQHLDLIAGGRYSSDLVSFDGVTRDATGIYSGSPAGTIIASLDESHRTTRFSYTLGINYHLSQDVMAYATAGSAYKAGVFYGLAAVTPAAWGYTSPESVRSYELGIKSRLLANRLQLNGAVFHTDYTDRQSSVTVTSPLIFATLANIPRSVIDGAEFELLFKPIAAWELRGSASYLDARITQTTDSVRGLAFLASIPVGTSLPQSPKWSFNGLVRHESPVGSNFRLSEQLSYSWIGRAASVLGDANAFYGPVRSLSARLSLVWPNGRWHAALWAENLANDAAVTYGFTNSLTERLNYLQKPRSFGVTAGYSF
jgi:iron complex outermembrane receptor protein